MERIRTEKRPDWKEKAESAGFLYHTFDGETYWDESAYYSFTSEEIDHIEEVTEEVHDMCIRAAEHIIRKNLFSKLCIPEKYVPYIIKSWENNDPSLYGRFDFSYNGSDAPKMLEYNADTPTSVLEASVVQWFWLKDKFPEKDQFNSIHEKLQEFWKESGFRGTVHFACADESAEDLGNLEYLRDTAIQSGFETKQVFIEEIGWNSKLKRFVDGDDIPIYNIFKLYPWEWMFEEEFGEYLPVCGWNIIEPPWKSLISTKAILPVLWDLYEGHQNLLPCYFDNKFTDNFVKKPLYSREGNSISIFKDGKVTENPGSYGKEGFVYQKYCPLPEFEGNFPALGSWVVNGKPAGIGIREDSTEITSNNGRFLPHLFEEE